MAAIDGRVGHHVLTPLVRQGGAAVLVDRGWVPADRAHPATRREGQPAGPAEVAGIARYRGEDRPGWFTPDNRPAQGLWYWYDLPRARARARPRAAARRDRSGRDAQSGRSADRRPGRAELPNNHLQYAITWYGLAAGLLGVWIGFGLAAAAGAA